MIQLGFINKHAWFEHQSLQLAGRSAIHRHPVLRVSTRVQVPSMKIYCAGTSNIQHEIRHMSFSVYLANKER